MDENKSFVIMLRESLEKKVSVLKSIVRMNEEQKEILLDPASAPEALEQNLSRKGGLIKELTELDSGFEQVYARVKEAFTKDGKEAYRDEIHKMQDLIRQITDLSTSIQAEEERNKDRAEKRFSTVRQQAERINKSQKAVSSYYQNMMKLNSVDPQFMDSKK